MTTVCLMTIAQFCERHPGFGERGMRYLIQKHRNEEREMGVRRIGRRILLDEKRMLGWIEQKQ